MDQTPAETQGPGGRHLLTEGRLLFLFVFLVFEVSVNSVWATDHATSLVKLGFALLENHSAALGSVAGVPPYSVDTFRHAGQTYSALAPGTAILALPFLAVAFVVQGGFTAFGPTLLLSETFTSIAGAGASYLVYRIGTMYFRKATGVLLGLAFGLSTICWPFATYFFQSDVSAVMVLMAAYFVLKAGRETKGASTFAVASGLALGLGVLVDYVNLGIAPILVAFLMVRARRDRRGMLSRVGALALGTVPGLLTVGAYNMAIFGNPLLTPEQGYLGTSLLMKFSNPLLPGLALNTISLSRGIFFFAPFTLFGVLGLAEAVRAGKEKLDMGLLLAIFLAILIPYSAWYDPTGGISFGPRFLAAGIPFLVIPAGYIVERARGLNLGLVYAVFAAGAVVNGIAAFVTAVPPVTAFDVSPFVSYVLPSFLQGDIDSLWAAWSGPSWVVGAALVAVLGVLVPIMWVERIRRRELGWSPAQADRRALPSPPLHEGIGRSAASGIRTRASGSFLSKNGKPLS